jgi:TonB-linked SusC/RagA family outer membrane protein
MRLTTIIILGAIMQVSASSYAQRVTLNERNSFIGTVLDKIRQQSGYGVIADESILAKAVPVSVSVKDVSLEEALALSFKGQPITYEVKDKLVIIKIKQVSLLDQIINRFKNIDVSGRLVDSLGNPIPGGTIRIKGTNRTTVSSSSGNFSFTGVDEQAVLQISYIGYKTIEIPIKTNLGNVVITIIDGKLEEVEINAGYYTVKDKERTGSISRITAKDIEKQPVNNVLQAMQANIPGVQITQTTGLPGGGFTIRVRGQNSLTEGNEPFYIIDGVPFTSIGLAGSRDATTTRGANPLASINPSDIESIEVLKDADATAIYGSRGANGVILISTKKGKEGDTKTSVSINQGVSRVGKKVNLMNTDQYIAMRKEALSNDKLPTPASAYDINGTWDPKRYVDWQKEMIGGIAPTTNIQTSLSGGVENITYMLGGAYYQEGTVFKGNNSFRRGSGNISLQYLSDNKKLNLSFDANYSQLHSNALTTDLTQFISLPPNYPALVNESGIINWQNNTMYENPIALTQRPYNSKTSNLISNILLSYKIFSEFSLKTSVGYTIMDRDEISRIPLSSFSPALNYGSSRRVSTFTNNSLNTWNIEAIADYIKKIGNGKLSILTGTTFQQGLTQGQEISGSGYNNDALMGNIGAASILSVLGRTNLQYRYTALFGRLNYNLDSKYILNLTGRRDGSSRFGLENRFANFGAIGVAWIISNENFVKEKMPFLSLTKLRGSYGVTGNDQIPDYGYLELWNTFYSTYQGISTMYPSQITNPNYAWEINKKVEVAIELGFLKDQISLAVGYYSNRSSNQLISKPLAPSLGFEGIQDNLPAKVSNTGVELDLNTKNFSSKTFNWSTSINLTIPKTKLISFPNLESSNYASTFAIGQPLSIRKLFNTFLDSQTGLFITEDYDKNGIITFGSDQYITKFVGRKFYGGLQNSFSYKGLGLDLLFQFVNQTGISYLSGFGNPGSFFASSPTVSNQPVENLENWKSPGDQVGFQKFSTTSSASFNRAKTFGNLAFEDASFIRLKNVSLSYSLPTNFTQKLKVNAIKINLQAQNLFTITTYKGLDPETQSLSRLPSLQVFTAGLQLNF